MGARARAATAGAAAATVWGLAEPLDQKLLRCGYSDIALLGKAVSRRHWRAAGFALHALNGAAFGLAVQALHERSGADKRRLALGLALIENVALFPLGALTDRYHPARDELPRIATSPRAFAQATWRHALFGFLLGRWA